MGIDKRSNCGGNRDGLQTLGLILGLVVELLILNQSFATAALNRAEANKHAAAATGLKNRFKTPGFVKTTLQYL